MREIKYRAWLKEEKKMVEVEEIDLRINKIGFYTDDDYEFRSFEDVELMQFTGLYAKKEKPIYEGDIVRVKMKKYPNKKTGYIYYDEIIYSFCLKHYFEAYENWIFSDEIEVLGNIYENADLLEEE